MNWQILIPSYHDPDQFVERGIFESYEEALEVAQRIWDADQNGNINIIDEMNEEDDDEEEEASAL